MTTEGADRMRVLHVCGQLGYYGAENVLALLVQHTHEPDFELAAMSVNRPAHPEAQPKLDAQVFAIDRNGRRDVMFLPRMVAAMRRFRPCVVHTHGHHGRYWGRLAAVLAGVPLIVHTEHNPDLTPPKPRWFFRSLNALLNPRTKAFIDFTEPRRRNLAATESIPLERIVVIPNGIPVRAVEPGDRERAREAMGVAADELAILITARLYAQKRHDRALDAFAALPSELRSRARLAIAGEGPLRDQLEQRARDAGIAERVTFLGHRADAAALLAGADVAMLTSEREAMPLAIIEAMLYRAPIVTTPWDGARAMLGDGRYAFIAESTEPAAIAAALSQALTDRSEAAARARAAYDHARIEFDVLNQARRYAALYRELSAPKRAASELITAARS